MTTPPPLPCNRAALHHAMPGVAGAPPIDGGSEFLEVPRLSILHLILWTAVTAVLLAVMRGFAKASSGDLSGTIFAVLWAILGAACLTGAGVLVVTRFRHRIGRLHFGHFLLILLGIVWLDVATTFCAVDLLRRDTAGQSATDSRSYQSSDPHSRADTPTTGHRSLSGFTIIGWLLRLLVIVVLVLFAVRHPRIALPLIGVFGLMAVSIIPLSAVVTACAFSGKGAGIVFFFMGLYVLASLAAGVWLSFASRRLNADWLHWLGIVALSVHPLMLTAYFFAA
ncbi:MAG: hypothetical protein JW818_12135 [Pirellulales bacterium]|nr:hypothetical protein [Pirellulales bacterium]